MKIVKVNWDDIVSGCVNLCGKLMGTGFTFDKSNTSLLVISRGGLAPSAVIANTLNIDCVETICLSSYENKIQGNLKLIKPPNIETLIKGKSYLLIIDDIVDSGKTINFIKENYHFSPSIKVFYCALYVTQQCIDLPDIYCHVIPNSESNTWYSYPWELEVLESKE